jgi:peptidoglycan/LPS O-acetylase OafA/YrhL
MSREGRNPALDFLRCAAIVAVLVAHLLPHEIADAQLLLAINTLAQRGVDLFFVLSGYLIGGIALREVAASGGLRVGRFWLRRWLRTLPAYYATLLLYSLKELLPHRSAGLVKPWAFVFFIQSYVIGSLPDFAHSWSLCVEEHFYLALPVLIAVLNVLGFRRPWHVAGAVFSVAMAFAVHRWVALWSEAIVTERVTHFRTDALSVGVLLACAEVQAPALSAAVRHRVRQLCICGLALLGLAGALNLADSAAWQSMFALAFGVWVAIAAARVDWLARLGAAKPIATIARISYSLYLLHPLVVGTLDQLYFRKRPETLGSWSVFVVLALFGSLVAALACHRTVEQTFLRLRDRIS